MRHDPSSVWFASGSRGISLLRYVNNRNVGRNLTHRFAHRYTEADPTSGLAISRAWSTEWTVDVSGQSVGGPVVFDCTENCLDVTFARDNVLLASTYRSCP